MARDLYLRSLGSDQRSNLFRLLNKYVASSLQNQAIDSLINTGKISDDILQKSQEIGLFRPNELTSAKTEISRFGSQLPDARSVFTKFLEDTKNEADATDETLRERIEAYQGLAGSRPVTGATTTIGGDLQGTSEKIYGPQPPASPETNENIKRIQDILATRAGERGKAAEAERFLVETPAELERSRQGFLAEQEQGLSRTLRERTAPQVLRELNTRGLAESPDVLSEISRRGSSLQAGIESNIRDLETQDAQFFADAAFRIQTAKLNQKESDFRSSLDLERRKIRGEQQNRFQTAQEKINSDFELDTLRREQERNLRLQQAGINFDTERQRSAANVENAGQIGQSIGDIIGTKIGSKLSSATVNDTKQSPSNAPKFDKVG